MSKVFYARDAVWTKETIVDQLDRDGGDARETLGIKPSDISDDLAQQFAEKEYAAREYFPAEEEYIDDMIATNKWLIHQLKK